MGFKLLNFLIIVIGVFGSEVTVRWYLILVGQEEQQGNVQPRVVWGYLRVDGVCHLSPSFSSQLVNIWGINGHRRQPTTIRYVFRRIRSTTRFDVWCHCSSSTSSLRVWCYSRENTR